MMTLCNKEQQLEKYNS